MLKKQLKFQLEFGFNNIPLKDIASAILAEGGELWQGSEGKWWSKKRGDRKNQIEELVDLWHFMLTYMITIDVTEKEFVDAYYKKLEENCRRQKQKGGYKG